LFNKVKYLKLQTSNEILYQVCNFKENVLEMGDYMQM